MSDPENRLIQIIERVSVGGAITKTVDYAYDAAGRRIQKNVDSIITAYVYDGSDILFEYDGASVLQARYTHGPGIDEPLIMDRAGQSSFYHADGLGSVTELTDNTGVVVQAYLYDSYGNIIQVTGVLENPYTYTGRELDTESGLYFYRARYYDPNTGRFINEDPIGFAGLDVNLFRYVGNNPFKFTDPAGLSEEGDDSIEADPLIGPDIIGGVASICKGVGKALFKKFVKIFEKKEAGKAAKALPAPKIQIHHIFPQAHREWFGKRGIDIDKYTIKLEKGTHLAGVHGKGGFVGPGDVKLPGRWNQRWNDFIKNNPNATAKNTFQFSGSLLDEFGLNNLPIGPSK